MEKDVTGSSPVLVMDDRAILDRRSEGRPNTGGGRRSDEVDGEGPRSHALDGRDHDAEVVSEFEQFSDPPVDPPDVNDRRGCIGVASRA